MKVKERACILCGRRQLMQSFVCDACTVRIQGEILGQRRVIRNKAEAALKGFGERDIQPTIK